MPQNRLAEETSPYLLQHKDNPVDWRPWGEAALAEARQSAKPILLSVGYAACHWCHVMAHESFEDPETARVMNELFVNIKVDREERPDIDAIYQSALALLGESGGWPLTMFLTPGGEPFWGGTYFPPSPRFGRPGFRDVLRSIAETHRAEPEKVAKNVGALREALGKLTESRSGERIQIAAIDRIAQRLAREVDPFHGGIGQAPKFPQPSIFLLLWRAFLRTGQRPYLDAVTVTLDHMCQGGIYDHLGGGFARYSTDEQWLAPHFEKMLYDNAQLIDLLTLVWQDMRNPLYAARVAETVEWALREMIAEGGGFASTLDADSEGEEGKFYVWTEAEIDRLLGPASPRFKAAYDVTRLGNWEGHTILNRNRQPGLGSSEEEGFLARARQILLEARGQRIRPGWDDKVLADWNGLMIAALAFAAGVFRKPAWLDAARRAFAFVESAMQENGRLHHAWRAGQRKHPATLDDYANMIRAALALFEATGEARTLEQAEAWVAVIDRHYWDGSRGGYFFTADDTDGLILRTRTASDNATPAGNGTLVGVLARLHHLTGTTRYRDRAEAIVAAFSGELERNFFPYASLLNGSEFLERAVQIAIIGGRDDDATEALLRAVEDLALPNRVLLMLPPGAALPPEHPAAGKGQLEGRATAYVCVGPTCSQPVTEAALLKGLLLG
ncbi:MAG: thioredoxin domain-containing protein [Proteobacteria bacterium]|nr:thioredoxin domain-containing protein [Pseudomonadota bacterium]